MLETEECWENATNATWWQVMQDTQLAELPVLIAGSVVFCLVLPFVLFEFHFFPIGTTTAVLIGALLMVLCQVVSQEEAYQVIGQQGNLTPLFLLLGMLLLAQYVEREQLLVRVLRHCLRPELTFPNYIWRVSLLAFVFAAFFTSDACCSILTPLLLRFWEVQERPHTEMETILLAITTMSNIGSVTSIYGTPHMALIVAKTHESVHQMSKLDLQTCLLYLGPPAIVAFFINLAFLILHHRFKTRMIEKSKLINEKSVSDQEMAGLTARENGNLMKERSSDKSQMNGTLKVDRDDFLYEGLTSPKSDDKLNVPCQLETILEDEVLEITNSSPLASACTLDDHTVEFEDESDPTQSNSPQSPHHTTLQLDQLETHLESIEYKPSKLQATNASSGSLKDCATAAEQHGLRLTEKVGVYRSLSAFSAVDFLPLDVGVSGLPHSASCEGLFAASDSIVFQVLLSFIILATVGLLLATNKAITFDIGLIPMGAAVIAIAFDAILNRQNALVIFKRVDWSILMMFFGIYIWMHGFNKTRLPHYVWTKLGLSGTLNSPLTITILCGIVLLGTNIFSSVPLTLMILSELLPCRIQLPQVLYLAWTATIAGNLTLFGSLANLIVAQKGLQTLKVHLTFCAHLRYGFLSTLVITSVGVLVIYGLLLI